MCVCVYALNYNYLIVLSARFVFLALVVVSDKQKKICYLNVSHNILDLHTTLFKTKFSSFTILIVHKYTHTHII